MVPSTVFTVGHSTHTEAELGELLELNGVRAVVDVRTHPGSRRLPHFNRDALAASLPQRRIEYAHLPALGGRRKPKPDSPNGGWEVSGFRGYADHMGTPEFGHGLAELERLARDRPTAAMCAEALWWRCHRRLLADHLLLVEGVVVEHLFHDGRVIVHAGSPEARRQGDHLVYDADAQRLLFPDPDPDP